MSKREISKVAAKILIDIGAINFSPQSPFKLSSGFLSPSYIDCRKIIAYPSAFKTITDMMIDTIKSDMDSQSPDYIIGGETAGIPFAAFIAERLSLPMQYVRKKPKGFGRDALIEGDIKKGQRILLVEDLTTDGGSKLNFANAIRKVGAIVNHTFVIFYYDIFKDTISSLQKNSLNLHYLATWWDVLNCAKKLNKFDQKTLQAVEKFLNNPKDWSKENGGK